MYIYIIICFRIYPWSSVSIKLVLIYVWNLYHSITSSNTAQLEHSYKHTALNLCPVVVELPVLHVVSSLVFNSIFCLLPDCSANLVLPTLPSFHKLDPQRLDVRRTQLEGYLKTITSEEFLSAHLNVLGQVILFLSEGEYELKSTELKRMVNITPPTHTHTHFTLTPHPPPSTLHTHSPLSQANTLLAP